MSHPEETSSVTAKQQHICETLRRQIVEGKLAPGAKLPTQVQLVELFQVSGVTVQRAIDRLLREGFVCTRGRNGTFVTNNPPHLRNFGLVFLDQPSRDQHRSRYHEMLESQALRLSRDGQKQVTVFNGVTGHPDDETTQQLMADVRAHRMAGLILVDPDPLEGTPVLDEPGVPRVAIMSRTMKLSCPTICPDIEGMIDRGLDALVAAGRARIGVVATVPLYQGFGEYLRQAIRQRPIVVHERWIQVTSHLSHDCTRNAMLLMMEPTNRERPDGLFIMDDNLLESASMGLVKVGVRVPDDVTVVAHCNFPWLAPSVLPVTLAGFDTQAMLDEALRIVDMQRQGQTPPPITMMEAIVKDAAALQ